jgi:hypothetical protein
MSPPESSKSKPIPDQVPRGLRMLPLARGVGNYQVTPHNEFGAQLKAEAAALERWWAQPRWKNTKRIYSGTLCYSLLVVQRSSTRI